MRAADLGRQATLPAYAITGASVLGPDLAADVEAGMTTGVLTVARGNMGRSPERTQYGAAGEM